MRLARLSLAQTVIELAARVHQALGPGLISGTYRHCLMHELALAGVSCACDVPLRVTYKGLQLDTGASADLIVEGSLLVAIAGAEHATPVIDARLRTCLRLSRVPQGLLINFNVAGLEEGISSLSASTATPSPDGTSWPRAHEARWTFGTGM